ncbi:MAG: family 43 glycosylhydrolase [Rikenellaceae bacterium]
MNKKFTTILSAIGLSIATLPLFAQMSSNPVFPGDFSDPGVFRVGDDYYAVRSTFGWQPGLHIIHSKDLINWEYIGHAFDGDNEVEIPTGEVFGGIWGSDMVYNPNTKKFMVYAPIYSNPKTKAIYVFTSDTPEGPYSKGVKILDQDIDPGIFIDDDNFIYLSSKASMIYKLTPDGLKIEEEVSRVGSNDGKAFGEGAEIVKKNGYYYYTCSEGGTLPYEHHKVLSFRSKSLKGPWEPDPTNPVKYSPHTERAAIQGPGHGELIHTQNGEWYMTYHTYELNYATLARQMCLEPVIWTSDGWWRPKYGKIPPVEFETPNLPKSDIRLNQSDSFDGASKLAPQWFFHTKPDYSGVAWSLTDNKNSLRIKNYSGDRDMTQTLERFMLQSIVGKDFELSTKLSFASKNEGEMAGLLLYTNMENFVQYGLTTINGERMLQVKLKYGAFDKFKGVCKPNSGKYLSVATLPYDGDNVYLKLKVVNPESAYFQYSKDGKNWEDMGNTEIFFGRGGMPDLGWQHTFWTGATQGLFIDSQSAQTSGGYADFEYFNAVR